MKPLLSAFLIVIMVGGFSLAGTLQLDTVKAATEVTGILSSDTTWTKANSPYTLTGPAAVGEGVTLKIEASTELASIPKPSVPEFTVALVDSSYDVPTTYSIDPYTGENVTHEGYHVESTSIEVKIKNQPFSSFWIQENPSAANWTVHFYYNIRIRGHFSEGWIELYRASDGYPHQDSESEYTVGTYTLGENTDTILGTKMIEFPPGAQVDFQVEAMIGYVSRDASSFMAPLVFTGEKSGWSETQTITLPMSFPSSTSSPSPTSTSEPTSKDIQTLQSEAILGAAIAVAVISAGLGVVIYLVKRK